MHAWQLHHDAVNTLLLDHRFGHAELVDPVVQGGDVLLQRLVLHAARGLGTDGGDQTVFGAFRRFGGLQISELVLNHRTDGVQRLGVAGTHLNGLPVAADAAMAHAFFTQGGAQVAGQHIGAALQRCGHVHLQHKVDATAQVQAQVHG